LEFLFVDAETLRDWLRSWQLAVQLAVQLAGDAAGWLCSWLAMQLAVQQGGKAQLIYVQVSRRDPNCCATAAVYESSFKTK
jgi:hypothetical protein